MNTGSGKSSKTIIWVIIIIIVLIGVMLAMRNKSEAPVTESGAGMSNSQLQAEVDGAINFDNEASLKAIDQEFTQ